MSMKVGIRPGEVFQGTDTASGKVAVGTRGQGFDGKEYVFCLVAASQNLVSGNVVTISGTGSAVPMYTAIILASASPAPGAGAMCGVAVCSVTASASAYIWVQVYGSCAVLTTDTTASNLPNHLVTPSSVPGAVRGGLATASSFVDGLVFTVTASTAANYAAFLNYPHLTAA
jgi:hypothetical protein